MGGKPPPFHDTIHEPVLLRLNVLRMADLQQSHRTLSLF